MNITFLIGNGFDINLGLNTRYTDVYKEYIKEESSSNVIKAFKEDLKKDEMNNYENWSDFELGMAQYSVNFEKSKDFLLCLRDFKIFLSEYLNKQNENFVSLPNIDIYVQNFKTSLNSYAMGFVENVHRDIDIIKSSEDINFQFVSFNYTSSLDILLEGCKSDTVGYRKRYYKNPLHIHGICGSDIALGVDNPDQISNPQFRTDKKVLRAFVKPQFNEKINSSRMYATKELINKSDIICAFGMSFGDSDKMWKDSIKNWLLTERYLRHFIFYCYPDLKCSVANPDEGLDLEEDEKENLKKIFEFSDNEWDMVEKQIHIPVNFKAFDFSDIKKMKHGPVTVC